MPPKAKARCPVCRMPLSDRSDVYEDWKECETPDCRLMGLEGFSHHWKYIAALVKQTRAAKEPKA
ncbi:hypothetical protein LJC15_00030 [Desulfovibrio sp. OttesenSCG-928-G11]|nr:hypothetical protein [Desulfovibrio sp. OttesenSCG-928-G11]